MPEPKLFLDVDGCLLVHADPGGYHKCEYKGKTYWYHPQMPEWLQALDVAYDIRWSSHSWRGKDAEFLAKMFGIDTKLTHLNFDHPNVVHTEMRIEKLEAIDKLYDGPCAIVDDRMGEAVEKWAQDRIVLLVQPEKAIGITEAMFNLLKSFGDLYQTKAPLVRDFVKSARSELVLSNGEWF